MNHQQKKPDAFKELHLIVTRVVMSSKESDNCFSNNDLLLNKYHFPKGF